MNKVLFLIVFFILSFATACNSHQTNELIASNNSINTQERQQTIAIPTATQLSEEKVKRRDEIQNQMLKGENLHDGSIDLTFIGDINSVPALLMVLKNYPPDSNGGNVCTAGHALEALEKITGKKVGIKYEQWNSWWIKYKKKQKNVSK